MPRTRANNCTYAPIDPAPQQKHFSTRRTSVKPRAGGKLPALTMSQSTLTQIGWPTPTPERSMEIIDISSDEDNVHQDTEPSRPKKRRRTAAASGKKQERTESQPSITQAVRSASARRSRRSWLDDDGWEVFEDPETAEPTTGLSRMERLKQQREKRDVGALQLYDWTMKSDSGYDSKIEPVKEQSPEIANSSSQLKGDVEDEGYHAQLDDNGGLENEYTPLTHSHQTPRNMRFTNTIPSSQSPASIKLSTGKSVRFKDAGRSPLKERSGNARSPLKRMAKAASPYGKSQAVNISDQKAVTDEDEDPTPRPPQRSLKRVRTVQDSQYDDLDFDPDMLKEPVSAEHEHTGDSDENEDDDENYASEDAEDGATCDPAYSALDRDAARFGITQTQGAILEPHVSNSTCSDEEDLLEKNELCHQSSPELGDGRYDPSHQLSDELKEAAASQDQEKVPSSQPGERGGNDGVDQEALVMPQQPVQARIAAFAETAVDEEEHIPSSPPPLRPSDTAVPQVEAGLKVPTNVDLEAEERVPSSPPPLRPSQVSTQAPTQVSSSRPHSRGNNASLAFTSPQKSIPATFASTWKPETQRLDIGSSSPLPLPPWSSPERMRYAAVAETAGRAGLKGKRKQSEEMDCMGSLVDFSLPPPPPMSSSRAGTQSGGGSSSPSR